MNILEETKTSDPSYSTSLRVKLRNEKTQKLIADTSDNSNVSNDNKFQIDNKLFDSIRHFKKSNLRKTLSTVSEEIAENKLNELEKEDNIDIKPPTPSKK
jgi:hypothetical protein